MKSLVESLYVIALSLWVGGMSLFTFILTPVIFKSYPREAAGEVVGKLFPSYFLFTLAVSAAALALFLFSFPFGGAVGHRVSLLLLSLAVIAALYVNFRLYPEARKAKREVHSFEGDYPDSPARTRFRRLHRQSAVLNFFMIADGLLLLVMSVGIRN